MAKAETIAAKTLECWHGVNGSPKYYPFHRLTRVLIPANLLYDGTIPLKYPLYLKSRGVKLMLDSGAARYFLNSDLEKYPINYLTKYLYYVRIIQPDVAWSLDFCFEKPHLQTEAKLLENFESQLVAIEAAKAKGLTLYPVVNAYDKNSYQQAALWVKDLLEKYQLDRYGIGSICRAKEDRVKEVLEWIGEILPLNLAHGFGQTQRTTKILFEYGLKSLDTSNASSNAGYGLFCNPDGSWVYYPFQDLPKAQRKQTLFTLNAFSLEIACSEHFHSLQKVQEEG